MGSVTGGTGAERVPVHPWKYQLEQALTHTQAGQALAADLTKNHDPLGVAAYLNMEFAVVFYEPQHQRSLPATWCCIYLTYRLALNGMYNLLVCVMPLCTSCLCGTLYGILGYLESWCLHPALRFLIILSEVGLPCVYRCVHCCCQPITDACTEFSSSVKIQFLSLPHYASDRVLVV
ncbi:caveolin-1-like isoform X1 [Cherax quadricarinatus]|uniref:caveolin-1-like isoform X1 n=1 Tax=Cherax quadricarinatus TaxID=27406 RepID=UPI00387E5915